MSEHQLTAVLSARDNGLTSTIRRAQKETEKLQSTIGKAQKDQELRIKLGVEGMERLQRLQSAIQSARQKANQPLSVRLRDQATQQLSKIRAEISALTGKAHNIAVNVKANGLEKLNSLKSTLSEGIGGAAMGMGATMLGSAGIGYGVVNAVQSQMSFEKQMSSVKAVLSGSYSGEELEKHMTTLTELAEKMGATTKFTAKEAGDALYYMGMAGWKSEQMVSGLPAVLNLAAAGNVELGQASDILTDSMTGFGLRAGESVKNAQGVLVESSKHYADLMAALVTNANTDVLQAGESLKYSAANVGAMFANGTAEDRMRGAEDLFLLTGLMANAGIKGSQSGTAARALFARLGSQNRNASFALQALGVDFTDENQGGTGEVRRVRDIIGDLRSRFKEGVSPEQLLDFAETLEGTKLHADTRRKLEGFIKHAQANGGKLPGGEMLKMAAMLNGQEGMSGLLAALLASEEDWNKLASAIDNADGAAERMAGIQLDNLAGSVTLLGSAWDAFQRSFVKGDAGAGLRSFVDSVTDSLSKANELFKDGIDFSDLVALGADAVSKLKNKFLEFDGIGSILAGGALFMGMKKLITMAMKLRSTIGELTKIRSLSELGKTQPVKAGSLGGAASAMNVSTMNVRAGVVNLSGAIKGGLGGKGAMNQARVDAYYAKKQAILSGQTSGTIVSGGAAANAGRIATYGKAMGGAGLTAALFGALDVFATRSNSEYLNSQAAEELKAAQSQLQILKAEGADVSQIMKQMSVVQAAEANVRNVAEINRQNERVANAGATGMLTGSMIGAAMGAAVPVIGPIIGSILGGVLGQYGGEYLAEMFPARDQRSTQKQMLSGSQSYHQSTVAALSEKTGLASAIQKINEEVAEYRATPEGQAKTRLEQETAKKSKRQELLNATWLKDYSDEEIRVRSEDTAKKVQARQTLLKENQENIKNFGGTSLGQNYLGVQGAVPTGTPIINKNADAVNYLNKRANELKGLNSARFSQPLAATTQGAVNLSSAFDNLNAKITGVNNSQQIIRLATPQTQGNSVLQNVAQAHKEAYNFKQPMTPLPQVGSNIAALNSASYNLPEIGFSEFTSETFESVKNLASSAFKSITSSFSTAFDTAKTSISGFSESITSSFSTAFDTAITSISSFGESITSSFSTAFDTAITSISAFSESITSSFSTAFESLNISAATTFANLSALISGGVETARATITTAFSSAAAEVQGIWGAIPGFFGGIFGSLGGIAAAAGSAIAAGINSGIGMIMGAWEALSGWLSAKISSLASMAAGAAASIGIGGNAKGTAYWQGGFTEVNEHGGELIILPSGQTIYPYQTTQNVMAETRIAHNAKGTSWFSGGFTEVNEHGGELMYLPTGTKIIPHATTVRILRDQIKERINANTSSSAEISKNVGASLFTNEIGGAVTSQLNNVANSSTTQGYFGNNRTFNYRSTRNSQFGGRIEDFTTLNDSAAEIQAQRNFHDENKNYYERNNTTVFKQSQWQNSAASTLETNAGFNSPRYRAKSGAHNFYANAEIVEPSAIGNFKISEGSSILKIAHNAKGTSFFSGGFTEVNEHGGEIISLPNGKNILPQITFQNVLKDSLGNIQGLNIPEYNLITENDSVEVKRAKIQAQENQYYAEKLSALSSIKNNRRITNDSNSAGNSLFKFQNTEFASRNSSSSASIDNTILKNFPTHTIFAPVNGGSRNSIFGADISSGIFGGIFGDIVNIWQQARKLPELIHANGSIMHFNSFGDSSMTDILNENNSFGAGQTGTLPTAERFSAVPAPVTSGDTTSNATTNNNQSKVNFNFGDVNISNGMDFDTFAHRLMTLFNQGANNSVMI